MRHLAGGPHDGFFKANDSASNAAPHLSRRSLVAGLGAALLVPARVARAGAPAHGPFTDLLQRYVVAGPDGLNRVRYARFKAEAGAALDRYIASLAETRVSGLGRDDAFAFWVNLYNAVTLQVVLAHYPVRSIREIDLGGGFFARGPWRRNLVTVERRDLSLDDIEHGILRKHWSEPRVHYAVNCASIGCPNLAREAWSGATLGRMLDEGARAFVNHRRGVEVNAEGVRASRIYSWFSEDFGTEEHLREHWRTYAGAALRRGLDANVRIAGYQYDWGLNDAG